MQGFGLTVPVALVAVACAAGPGFAAGLAVRNVQVIDHLSSVQGDMAAANWAHLSGDLRDAIASRLGHRTSAHGVDIRITISTDDIPAGAPAVLAGSVQLVQPARPPSTADDITAPVVKAAYDLRVSSKDTAGYLPAKVETARLEPNGEAYQQALVNSFADYVVAHLQG